MTLPRPTAALLAPPIGVFDSGVGGLTVAKAIAERMPGQRLIYLADQAHVPYGGRPLEDIRRFASRLATYLFRRGAKTIVMACNISSATALDAVGARFGKERVFGVIRPGARAALQEAAQGPIGVLATAGTVASGAYTAELRRRSPSIEVIEVACPRFVPLVEAGDVSGPAAIAAAQEYLEPIIRGGADTVILGCTHYPFLLPALERVAPERMRFIDPARASAIEVANTFGSNDDRVETEAGDADLFLTTGDPRLFLLQLERAWPERRRTVEHVPWTAIDPAPEAALGTGEAFRVSGD